MGIAQLKRTLRELKKVEKRIRFGNDSVKRSDLVWNRFFSTENPDDRSIRYPLSALLSMDRQSWKQVIEEYFYHLYYRKYKESGITADDIYDPALLATFGLPPDATLDMIRIKFRELAKKHHPDLGGDHEQMIEVLDTYRQLTNDAAAARPRQ